MSVRTLIQRIKWTPDLGDVLSGDRYVKSLFTWEMLDQYEPIALLPMHHNTWRALEKIDVEAGKACQAFAYTCPWTDNKYWHFMPWLVLAADVKHFRQPDGCWGEFVFDTQWIRDMWVKEFRSLDKPDVVEPDRVTAAMLGHGYTYSTLPSDGHGRNVLACLELSEESLIAGWLHIWYNK